MSKHGWTYKKLGECLSYIKNGANIKQTKGAEGIPITRIETLSGGVFNRDRLGYADIFTIDKYSQYIMDDGDILMSHINSKAYIGRAVLYRKEDNEQIIHGMNLLRLKVIPSLVHSNYLNLLFKSYYFRDRVAKIRKDAVNQSSMAISDLVKIQIPIPPLAEQKRIVEELDLLSSIIDKKKAQLKELDQLAQSIFYSMFGDPITNEKGWEMKSLGGFCEIKGRIGFRGYTKNDFVSNSNEGAISLSPTNIVNGSMDYSKCSYVTWDKYFESPEIMIQNGDILLVKTGSSYGKCSLVRQLPHEATINPQFVVIKDIKQNNIYLTFVLSSDYAKYQYDRFVLGTAIPTFSQKSLSSLPIPLPPLPLQQEFASKIEAIEQQKSLIQQSIVEVQTMFDYTMDKYFG